MAEQRETTILDVKLDSGRVSQDLDGLVAKIAALKDEQRQLTSEIKAGNDVNGEYAKRLIAVKDELSWTEKQAKGLTAATKLLTEDSKTYADTLNGQRQRLADLQKAYGELTTEQRNSEGGKAFVKAIKEQHDAVLELEQAVGQSQRNVGNYPKAITAVIPSFDSFTKKIDGFRGLAEGMGGSVTKAFASMAGGIGQATKAGLSFIATPIGAVITAIVVVVEKLSEAFKKNDAAGTALSRLWASFDPILQIVSKAFDFLATIIGKVADAISDLIGRFSDQAKAAQNLVTSIDDLEEKERQYTVNSAKRNRDVAKLREEAMNAKDIETRKAKLQEAINLEKQNLADEKAIAQQRLDNLKKTAKAQSDTSDATTNKIAEAEAQLYAAEQKYYEGTRRMKKELNGLTEQRTKTIQSAASARTKAREDEARQALEIAKRQASDEKEIRRLAEDTDIAGIEDEFEREREAKRVQGEREIADLQERLAHANDKEVQMTQQAQDELATLILEKKRQLQDALTQMDEEHKEEEAQRAKDAAIYVAEQRLEQTDYMRDGFEEQEREKEEARWEAQKELWALQMEEELANIDLTEEQKAALQAKWNDLLEAAERDHQEALIQIEKKADATRTKNKLASLKAAQNFLGTLSSSLAEYGEDSKAAAIASKALALGEIAVSTGTALAKGISQAQSVPFPANIAAIATTVTTIMANIFSAIKTVNSAKFSTGGVVGGGTYAQGDIVPAMLSPQEVVLNPTQTAQTLFAIANGATTGSGIAEMAEVVVAAVAAMPAPVMDYKEFTDFTDRVATYNELARI